MLKMKKINKYIAIITIVFFAALASNAQTPPHPSQNGNGSNVGGAPVGGGAPIDGGLSILIALGAAYGGRKIYQMKHKN
jgi:hypothetical protein